MREDIKAKLTEIRSQAFEYEDLKLRWVEPTIAEAYQLIDKASTGIDRMLLALIQALRDDETGEPVFTEEDLPALQNTPNGNKFLQELLTEMGNFHEKKDQD